MVAISARQGTLSAMKRGRLVQFVFLGIPIAIIRGQLHHYVPPLGRLQTPSPTPQVTGLLVPQSILP